MSAADAPREPSGEIVEDLRREIVRLSEGKLTTEEIDPGEHLFDCGYVDSLSAVMLLAYIEDRYGVLIEDVELIESLTSLDRIAAHVAQSR